FQLGQTAIVSCVCLLGFVWGVKNNRIWTVAICLTIASFKPQVVLVPVVFLVATGRWRDLVAMTGLMLPCVGVTTLVFGHRCWFDYLAEVRYVANQFGAAGVDPLVMYNVKGLLTAILGSQHADAINAGASAALLLSLAITFALWWRRPQIDGD